MRRSQRGHDHPAWQPLGADEVKQIQGDPALGPVCPHHLGDVGLLQTGHWSKFLTRSYGGSATRATMGSMLFRWS